MASENPAVTGTPKEVLAGPELRQRVNAWVLAQTGRRLPTLVDFEKAVGGNMLRFEQKLFQTADSPQGWTADVDTEYRIRELNWIQANLFGGREDVLDEALNQSQWGEKDSPVRMIIDLLSPVEGETGSFLAFDFYVALEARSRSKLEAQRPSGLSAKDEYLRCADLYLPLIIDRKGEVLSPDTLFGRAIRRMQDCFLKEETLPEPAAPTPEPAQHESDAGAGEKPLNDVAKGLGILLVYLEMADGPLRVLREAGAPPESAQWHDILARAGISREIEVSVALGPIVASGSPRTIFLADYSHKLSAFGRSLEPNDLLLCKRGEWDDGMEGLYAAAQAVAAFVNPGRRQGVREGFSLFGSTDGVEATRRFFADVGRYIGERAANLCASYFDNSRFPSAEDVSRMLGYLQEAQVEEIRFLITGVRLPPLSYGKAAATEVGVEAKDGFGKVAAYLAAKFEQLGVPAGTPSLEAAFDWLDREMRRLQADAHD